MIYASENSGAGKGRGSPLMLQFERNDVITSYSIHYTKLYDKILSLVGQLTALFQRIVPTLVDYMFFREMAREPDSPLKE